MGTYTLYVMSNSPYSDKIRALLRLKGLAVQEVRENLETRESVLKARTGRTMVPVLFTPDDEAMNESSAIARWIEEQLPTPAVFPSEAGRRALEALLEDYADEWLVRMMLSNRWHHPADAEQNATVIAAEMTAGTSGIDIATAKKLFPGGIIATMPAMGATPEALGDWMSELSAVLKDLAGIFAEHRFLAGATPGIADLSFYGQLNQIWRDPSGNARLAESAFSPVLRWKTDVERSVRGAEPEASNTAAPDAEALAPLLDRIARSYIRFAVSNALAVEEAPKGELEVKLGDGNWLLRAARSRYNRKCLSALLDELEAGFAAGSLVGGAGEAQLLRELSQLGDLLEPYPKLKQAALS